MKILQKLKKRYAILYMRSRFFRNLSNSLGVGLGSSLVYGFGGSVCPCCGQSSVACPIGLGAMGLVSVFFGGISFIYLSIRDFCRKWWGRARERTDGRSH